MEDDVPTVEGDAPPAVTIHARFDEAGLPVAFLASDMLPENYVYPDDAILISDAQWREFLAYQGLRRWDGSDVVPYEPPPTPEPIAPISDRQFFQALALSGDISEEEALSAVMTGTLPARIAEGVATLPNDQRFAARMLLSGATSFDRSHPMVSLLGTLIGRDDAALDALWRRASQL